MSAYTPSVDDVAANIITRTKDDVGVELGTFTVDTRPTVDQVTRIIGLSESDVVAKIDTDIPAAAYGFAKSAIALRAAMRIEVAFFPEQVNTGRSSYEQLKDDYKDVMSNLLEAVVREQTEVELGESTASPGLPRWAFPAVDTEESPPIGMGTVW